MVKSLVMTVFWLALLQHAGLANAFTFYDTFDSPSYTKNNWSSPETPSWDFVNLGGVDYGYHNATGRTSHDDSSPEGISIVNNGTSFVNAGLSITATFRLEQSNLTNWHQAGIFFGFDDSDPNNIRGYSVGLEIDLENSQPEFQLEVDAIGGEISPGQDHPREVNVPISLGKFYTLKVSVGPSQKISAYLYDDKSILLGSIVDISPVLPINAGKIGVKTGSEVTFNRFEVRSDSISDVKDNFILSIVQSIIAATQKNTTDDDNNNEESEKNCFKIKENTITIDGKFEDWLNISPAITDTINDVYNNDYIGFSKVYLAHDNTYLYVRFELTNAISNPLNADFDVAINFRDPNSSFISALFYNGPHTGRSNIYTNGSEIMGYPSSFASYSGKNIEFKVMLADLPAFINQDFNASGLAVNHTTGVSDGSNGIAFCGITGGDNISSIGCDGKPNSGLVLDACGICGGDGSSCSSSLGLLCSSECYGTICYSNASICNSSDLAMPCIGTATGMFCSQSCTTDSDCINTNRPMKCLTSCPNNTNSEGKCWTESDLTFLESRVCSQ